MGGRHGPEARVAKSSENFIEFSQKFYTITNDNRARGRHVQCKIHEFVERKQQINS